MRRKYFRIAIFLLVIMALVSVSSLSLPVKSAYLSIVSHSSYLSSSGEYYWINGEMQNLGTEAVLYAGVEATLYDAETTFIAVEEGAVIPFVVMPHQKAPFIVMFHNSSQASRVSRYTLDLSVFSSIEYPIPEGLRILSQSNFIDYLGYLRISGEVQNTGTKTASDTNVFVTCYDSNGTVVVCGFAYTEPRNIPQGEKATYDIMQIDSDRASLVDSFVLSAISEEYRCYEYPTVVIPEFSSYTLLLVSLTVVAVAVVIYKQRLRPQTN